MLLHSDHVKVYGEHVDGDEVTADIYTVSSLMLCKFTHKNVSSPRDSMSEKQLEGSKFL
jgi:hypothetical protein